MMPFNHFILCRPHLPLPSIPAWAWKLNWQRLTGESRQVYCSFLCHWSLHGEMNTWRNAEPERFYISLAEDWTLWENLVRQRVWGEGDLMRPVHLASSRRPSPAVRMLLPLGPGKAPLAFGFSDCFREEVLHLPFLKFLPLKTVNGPYIWGQHGLNSIRLKLWNRRPRSFSKIKLENICLGNLHPQQGNVGCGRIRN